MNVPNRLSKRLLWTVLLFLFAGAGTAGAAIEDFVVQVAYPAIEGATGSFSAGAIFSLMVGVSLGVFYFWAGFGLLQRQERWRRRAVYLSRILVGLLGLCFAVFLFGETSGFELEGAWIGNQSVETPLLPLPVVRGLALLLLGIMAGGFAQALRVLQSDSIQREFLEEKHEMTSTT